MATSPCYPGRTISSAIIMLTGYTIIAVPTGIVSAAMVSQQKKQAERQCPHCHQTGTTQKPSIANTAERNSRVTQKEKSTTKNFNH